MFGDTDIPEKKMNVHMKCDVSKYMYQTKLYIKEAHLQTIQIKLHGMCMENIEGNSD